VLLHFLAVKYLVEKKQVMAKANGNDNSSERIYLMWLYTSFALVFVLPILLSFPMSLIVSLIVVICLGIYRADMVLKKAGKRGIKDWYQSLSLLDSDLGGRRGINGSEFKLLRFSCVNCGNEHNKVACPKCGSKAVRTV
jgi:hypothetical protein